MSVSARLTAVTSSTRSTFTSTSAARAAPSSPLIAASRLSASKFTVPSRAFQQPLVRSRSARATSIATAAVDSAAAKISYTTASGNTTGTMIFRQLFEKESSTYTYLLADESSPGKPAILIDPVDLTVDRDIDMIKELGLTLVYACNTHVHADHITGTGLLKQRVPGCKSVIAEVAGAKADVFVKQGDRIEFGNLAVEVRNTPGHTNGCVTYVTAEGPGAPAPRLAFTGDAVLIRGCGRTDFQQGDSRRLYESVHTQIFSLPDETKIYPAHDYKGRMESSVGEEKQLNARLTKPVDEFVDIMANLGLPYPKKIDAALPANLVCGIQD